MLAFDPLDPVFLEDPYPVYARLRAEEPAHYNERTGSWVISRYDDVLAVLRDHRRFSSRAIAGGLGELRFLIGIDPPDHTTMRRLVNRPFHPAAIGAREPRIRAICHALVDDLIKAGRTGDADLIEHVGYPLPVIVIAEMLGIPPERRNDFKRWSDAMIGGLSPTADHTDRAVSVAEMFAYFNEVIAERRDAPGDDLISTLVNGPETLTNQELLMFCMLLLVAGNETTTNLVSNLALALFEHPEAADALETDPSLVPAAVEEALRYDAPVQCLFRLTTCDVEVAGRTIPADSHVTVLYGSANRDGDHYPDADRFVIDRNPRDHVGFGAGVHLCLGAPLARLEARVAFEVLLERTRDMRRAGDGERVHNLLVRGMRRLPVTFEEMA